MENKPLPELKLVWLGPPVIELNGHPIQLEMRKSLALLAYLSLAAQRPTRETLAALFWPDDDQQHAQQSLRRGLHSLTHSLPVGLIRADREKISLCPADWLKVDVLEFNEQLAFAKQQDSSDEISPGCLKALETAAKIYKGDFLEGFNLRDCPEFDAWQLQQRERLRTDEAFILSLLVKYYRERADWNTAISHARSLVDLDPLNEAAQRKLIDLFKISGQRNLGLRQYESLKFLLQEQLSQAPEAETTDLYQSLLTTGSISFESTPTSPQPILLETEPLIKTKLYIPPSRQNPVLRPQLQELLDEGARRSVTLVSAPAGFGKTTLLTGWAARTTLPIAWYTLDESDNDPVRFLAYLVAGLDSILPPGASGNFQALTQSFLPSVKSTLIQLVNTLAGEHDPFVLILDDYQTIHSIDIHQAVAFLIERMPVNMHLVIATRSDPPVSLARLRARDQLVEIRLNDLRFSIEETINFLSQAVGMQISREDAAALEARTEGWIAGLQMAALAIRPLISQSAQAGASNELTAGVSRIVQSFSGSNRYILDYLSEEVLNHCPVETRRFLFETSILERLSGPLCDALTGGQDSQDTLEWLERENLFVVPEDDERKWYRYHPIFAELLQIKLKGSSLRKSDSESSGLANQEDLHRRAATWFEENNFHTEAVHHYIAAREYERAAKLIESQAHRMFFISGQAYTLLQWINALPREIIQHRPRLDIARAWGLISQSRFKEAAAALEPARLALSNTLDPDADSLLGEIALVEGALAELSNRDVAVMRTQGMIAWQKLPNDAAMLRGLAGWLIGVSFLYDGDVNSAEGYLRESIRLCRLSGNIFITLLAVVDLGNVLRELGRFAEAYQLLFQIENELSAGTRPVHPALGYIDNGIAQILYAWNKLDEAERYLKRSIDLVAHDIPAEIMIFGLSSLGYLKLIQGKVGEATSLAGECLQKVDAYPLPYVRAIVRAGMVRFWIRLGDGEHVRDWISGCGLTPDDRMKYSTEVEYIALAKALLWKDEAAEALRVLAQLSELASTQGRKGKLITIQVIQAIALKQAEQPNLALDTLQKCLQLAQLEGLIRPFVDEGVSMLELLQLGLDRGSWQQANLDGFANKLIEALLEDLRHQVVSDSA